tara:strand:+ start:10430 stop:10729 length:300 start_codon:yes stop_codon:yes gene_type:complete
MQLTVAHQIGKSEAKNKIKSKIHEILTLGDKEITNLKQEWKENTLNFSFSSQGFTFYGETVIFDDSISITINLPFALKLFEAQLKSKLEPKLTSILLEG